MTLPAAPAAPVAPAASLGRSTQVSELGAPAEARPWIGPDGQVMRRLELHLTYHCPERCLFCSEELRMRAYRPYGVTWGRVATILRTHAERGVTAVHLTGGEPTIHPQFIEVLTLARKLGMRTSVGTIGTMLARPDFADRALPLLDEALFSLHGPDAATHDAVAGRPGSFETVTRAMENARARRPDFGLFVNSVACRQNIEALPDTAAFAESLGARLIVVSNTTPEGAALEAYPALAPSLEQLATWLPRVPPRLSTAILRFFGVPMCLLGPYGMLSNDLHWDPRVTVEWQSAPGKVSFTGLYSWAPDRKRVHVPACDPCARKSVCMGVFDQYAALWPTDRLGPG